MSRSQTWRRQYVASARQLRFSRQRLWIGLLVCACWFVLPACRASQDPSNSNTGPADTRKATFTTPPFSTKEPDRYQAIRITSITEARSTDTSPSSQSNQVLIARDGEKRREEYSAGPNGRTVYLEIPAGRFIVLPGSRIYADLSTTSDESDPANRTDDEPTLSPDQLLHESQPAATYERLGTELLGERTTTKYRVKVLTGVDLQNETLIWIDEALGMPVRSETVSNFRGHTSKVTMELKDIKLEVDERLFTWPSDYGKVEPQRIFDQIRKEVKGPTPKQEEK